MTKNIELSAEDEKLLAEAALRRGVSPDDFLRVAWREMAELDAAEDAQDLQDARRVRLQSDPSRRRTLDELRAALQNR